MSVGKSIRVREKMPLGNSISWSAKWASCKVCFVFVIAMACLRAGPADAEPWPITEFEVFPGPPFAQSWGDAETATYLDQVWSVFQLQDFELVGEIEAALSTAARKYEAMGFPPPKLEPIVTRADGTKAYRVYICNPSWHKNLAIWDQCGLNAAHVIACDDTQGFKDYLYFNSDVFFQAPYLRGPDFATIAHELFHAVHANMASGRGPRACQTGAWISEGLADAVSIDLARELWPGISYKDLYEGEFKGLGLDKEYGIRPYWPQLTHRFGEKGESSTNQYFTSSFWRHLGEWYHAAVANAGRRTGSSQTKSDYRFLVKFLDRPFEGPAGEDTELRWLEEGLRSTPKFATNLARVYSEFIASFADVLRTRIAPGYDGKPLETVPQERLDNYLDTIFSYCREITLSPSNPVAVKEIVALPVSAVCITLTVESAHGADAPETVAVEVSAGPKPRDELTPIWIGKSGGMEVSQLMVLTSKERNDAPAYGMVSLKVNVGTPTVFVVSNVAEYALETELLETSLTFMLSGWDSSMTKAPPDRAVPVRKKARPDDAKGKHEENLDDEFAEGLGKLTSNGQFSADLKVKGESGDCPDKKRQYNLCGPQLEIELELRPAAEVTIATNTTGGFMSQMGAGAVGQIANMSVAEINALHEMQDRLKPSNIEGGRIKIQLPRVEYGFTGSFENALISVSRDGGSSYKARTQTAVVVNSSAFGEPTRRRVPNGKVTIHQYTPLVLYGEFEATLLDTDPSRPYYPPNEVIPIARQVSGHFLVSNPFNNSQYGPDEESFKQQFGLDIAEKATTSDAPLEKMGPQTIEELCALGFDADMLEGLGIEGQCGPGDGPPGDNTASQMECDCSCTEHASPMRQQCEPGCKTEYALCLNENNDPQLIRLQQLLEASDFPPAIREHYISDFQTMNNDDRQILLNMLELFSDQ